VSQYDAGLGVFNSRIESSGSVYSLALAGKLSSTWKSTLTAGTGIDKALTYATAAAPSKFNTTQNQLTWQNDVQTGWGTLVLGLDNVNEKIDSTTVYAVNSRTTGSQFVGLSGEAGAHSWQTSARHDQNSQFGDANTGLLGYGYAVTDDLRVRGSYGTTFKAPSFNTLYFPVSGNPSTQPETGRNTEVGASYSVGANLISLTYYANRIQGFITSLPVVINIPFAKIEGSTLAIEGSEEGLSYRSALDFMNARNELTGQKLPRRSDWQFTSSLDYVSGAWSYGATVLAVSDFYNDAANLQALGGYTTLDVHVGYVVQKDWTLDGRIMNLGDKFYQTAYGYNQSGRAAYVTLRYAPK
jgi:vitamin B12 transporter